MIFVDSSVLIEFFNGSSATEAIELRDRFVDDELCIGDLVLAEVLHGFDTERGTALALEVLAPLKIVDVGGRALAIEAARNYRQLRDRGVTVRRTIDTLIATWCIRNNVALLYRDRDFEGFVTHLGLRSALRRY